MFRLPLVSLREYHTFPHTRGDVPKPHHQSFRDLHFSPHTWGCSVVFEISKATKDLFPTHVGMFRDPYQISINTLAFPHTRGDVPSTACLPKLFACFSPHTWGCSGRVGSKVVFEILFPTHVGMFRDGLSPVDPSVSFPHTRGDVPFRFGIKLLRDNFSPHTWGCSVL